MYNEIKKKKMNKCIEYTIIIFNIPLNLNESLFNRNICSFV